MQGALSVARHGSLWIGRFGGRRLFITYRELSDPSAQVSLVSSMIDQDESVLQAEWKTRTHDYAPGLADALTSAGFTKEPTESVMVGEASALIEADTPAGVTIREVRSPSEMHDVLTLQDAVFGGAPQADRILKEILDRQSRGDGVELWAAEVEGRFVSAGRIDPISGSGFAGIWGGVTLPEFRGRGIYRALTAARVRSAMRRGVRWIHSDSTEFSRPILERAGLVKVTETVPWVWQRTA